MGEEETNGYAYESRNTKILESIAIQGARHPKLLAPYCRLMGATIAIHTIQNDNVFRA